MPSFTTQMPLESSMEKTKHIFDKNDLVMSSKKNIFKILEVGYVVVLGGYSAGYKVKNLTTGAKYEILAKDAHKRWKKTKALGILFGSKS